MKVTDHKFIFVHIFKCAGTLFLGGLRYSYKSPVQVLNYNSQPIGETRSIAERAIAADLVHGHCYYGVHREINWEAVYLTVVRDPVDRVLSSYYYLQENRCKGHPLHELVNTYSLEECLEPLKLNGVSEVEKEAASIEFCNKQTRMLYGDPSFWSQEAANKNDLRALDVQGTHLERAKANLEDFSFVGLAQETDTYWPLLNQRFGFVIPSTNWNSSNPHFANKTKKRPTRDEIPRQLYDKIQEANSCDVQLYDHVVKIKDNINSGPIKVIK